MNGGANIGTGGKAAEIRRVTGRDRAVLVAIIDGTGNLTQEEKDCAIELLDIYLNNPQQKDYSFITAVDGSDCPIGYVCFGKTPLTDAVYDLYWIIVDGQKRRSGVGMALLGQTVELLQNDGARMLVAETSGLPAYDQTRVFYSKCGFVEEARIREFYKPLDDLVVYVKRF